MSRRAFWACHGDATRKLLPWNSSYVSRTSVNNAPMFFFCNRRTINCYDNDDKDDPNVGRLLIYLGFESVVFLCYRAIHCVASPMPVLRLPSQLQRASCNVQPVSTESTLTGTKLYQSSHEYSKEPRNAAKRVKVLSRQIRRRTATVPCRVRRKGTFRLRAF